jgi:transketolase
VRNTFAETLCNLAAGDGRLWLVTGDLGYSVLETFADRFPQRYVNAGVAEQNMTGLAAGLASTGKIVFTYSIANFPTIRCLEQVRNDVCYNRLPVKIVAVGGGYAYGPQGYTHHGVEDLAMMRALPGMTVVAPGDPVETALATRAVVDQPGPCYLRLGKAREPVVHDQPPPFKIGRAIRLRDGQDVTLISTGGLLGLACRAAEELERRDHVTVRVLSMHTVKPLDIEAIRAAARETQLIVTVEEHSVVGGLGSAVAEVLAEMPVRQARFHRFGCPDEPAGAIGSQTYLRARLGDLAERVRAALDGGTAQA